jgi:hypothetical protein
MDVVAGEDFAAGFLAGSGVRNSASEGPASASVSCPELASESSSDSAFAGRMVNETSSR